MHLLAFVFALTLLIFTLGAPSCTEHPLHGQTISYSAAINSDIASTIPKSIDFTFNGFLDEPELQTIPGLCPNLVNSQTCCSQQTYTALDNGFQEWTTFIKAVFDEIIKLTEDTEDALPEFRKQLEIIEEMIKLVGIDTKPFASLFEVVPRLVKVTLDWMDEFTIEGSKCVTRITEYLAGFACLACDASAKDSEYITIGTDEADQPIIYYNLNGGDTYDTLFSSCKDALNRIPAEIVADLISVITDALEEFEEMEVDLPGGESFNTKEIADLVGELTKELGKAGLGAITSTLMASSLSGPNATFFFGSSGMFQVFSLLGIYMKYVIKISEEGLSGVGVDIGDLIGNLTGQVAEIGESVAVVERALGGASQLALPTQSANVYYQNKGYKPVQVGAASGFETNVSIRYDTQEPQGNGRWGLVSILAIGGGVVAVLGVVLLCRRKKNSRSHHRAPQSSPSTSTRKPSAPVLYVDRDAMEMQ